jgi:hypothetical protein
MSRASASSRARSSKRMALSALQSTTIGGRAPKGGGGSAT